MGNAWMWGWELGTTETIYANSNWVIGGNSIGTRDFAEAANEYQPAAGYGGGRFCFGGGNANFNRQGRVRTPATGQGSTGAHTRFVFHDAFKRRGVTGSNGPQTILSWWTGAVEVLKLSHTTAAFSSVDSLTLEVWNGASYDVIGTTTTTYADADVYHRVVMDVDGATGDYDLYVDGILEISVTGSTTFSGSGAAVDAVQFWGTTASTLSATLGMFHDHAVLFDAGVNAEGSLSLGTVPTANDTVVIGAQTYTYKAALTPAANEVLIGASAADSVRNLVHAINLGPGSATLYAAGTTLNADVTAQIDVSLPGMVVVAKTIGTGPNAITTTETLTAGGDVWGGATLSGGSLDKTADLALALGDIFIQGLQPNADAAPGFWLNVGGANTGTNTDMFANVSDGQNLGDFIETTTSPDAVQFDHEDRADINAAWAPADIHAVQTIQVARGSGAITSGRTTTDIPSLGQITSDAAPLLTAGKMVNTLREWRGGNITTDVDGIKSGFEV